MDPSLPASAPIADPTIPLSAVDSEIKLPEGGPLQREPRGFVPSFGMAWFGIFVAITAPILGGLAVKVQGLVGLAAAAPQLGTILGAGALVSLVSQPIAGRLSDHTIGRFGMRRPWILAGMLGTFICLVVIGLATDMTAVLLAWCGAQLCSNFAQAAAFATVADHVPHRRRGFVSGVQGAAGPLAILAGAFGLSSLPTDLLRFLVPAALGLVLSIVFVLTFRDRVLAREDRKPLSVGALFASFVFNPRRSPDLGWAWLVKAMYMFGAASLATYLALFLATSFGMANPMEQLSFVLLATTISTVATVVFSLIGGPLSDRLGKRRSFVALGAVMLGAGLALTAVSSLLNRDTGIAVLLVAEAIMGAGSGLFNAVDTALVLQVLPQKENFAKDLGVMNVANAGGHGYVIWFLFAALVAIVGGLFVFKIKAVR